jgi:GT2 family glycosyltransferase
MIADSASDAPFLTIITIVRNARVGFLATAASVLREAPTDTDWVVVDGASTDGTVEEIRNVEGDLAAWSSEKDNGIADAFNKGVRLARGQYVLFLNAGDCLTCGAAEILSKIAQDHRGAPLIVGQIEMSGRRRGRAVPFWRQYMRNHLPHQAMLTRRDLFYSLGFFDEDNPIAMDYEWSLRLRNRWNEIAFVPSVIAIMEPGGVSSSNPAKTFEAWHRARVSHFGMPILSRATQGYYLLKEIIVGSVRPLVDITHARRARQ